ncbi:hypothetical protein NDU88_003888 [Pleurodeles waltl]|uniref:Uncharacterized protein n=1 Tax=Pleurodeles waltl TaxID=8319 RepID=A0AAV7UZR3_PLEWA|nr:hypothetical protein NDU88_003888 [Pleurodeles waltl]
MEGVKVTRAGRGKGEQTGSNKRLTTAVAKPAVENMLRGVKTSESSITTPPTEIKVKGKSQSTITTFLEGGAQDMRPVHLTLPSESKVVGTEPLPSSSSSSISGCIMNNDPSVNLKQGMPESEDSQREVREKNSGSYTEIKQPQAQQFDWSEQLEYRDGEGGASILKSTTEEENLHKSFSNTKTLGKIAGKVSQLVEWGKDNSDKFYSLTEESDLSSGDHSLGGSKDSETSETEDKTSSNEPTVRQRRRQRKLVKARPCAQGSSGNPSSMGGRNLKWDYAGIGLTDSSSITLTNQGSANGNKESDIGPPTYSPPALGAEAGMLQSIYNSIKELQTETRIESRRARVATKRLQGTVRKVAKSCTEIGTKLSLMEERIITVEEDVVNLKEQNTMRDEQLTDVMWKLEDFENRQRRNNLRILGIPEGLEGTNIRTYMINFPRRAPPGNEQLAIDRSPSQAPLNWAPPSQAPLNWAPPSQAPLNWAPPSPATLRWGPPSQEPLNWARRLKHR